VHRAPEAGEHRVIAPARKRLVGPGADKAHRTPDDDPCGQAGQRLPATAHQMAQKNLAQFLEPQALLEQVRVLECRACRHRLERLEEAAPLRKIEKFGDGPGTGGMGQTASRTIVLPEAQRRAKNLREAFRRGEID
jgi:hypothetical protein